MSSTAATVRPYVYVECDIPEGLTIKEWRRARHAEPAPRARLRRLARRVGF
jgi:hypothetical protein